MTCGAAIPAFIMSIFMGPPIAILTSDWPGVFAVPRRMPDLRFLSAYRAGPRRNNIYAEPS